MLLGTRKFLMLLGTRKQRNLSIIKLTGTIHVCTALVDFWQRNCHTCGHFFRKVLANTFDDEAGWILLRHLLDEGWILLRHPLDDDNTFDDEAGWMLLRHPLDEG